MKIINATVAEITEQDIMKKIEKCGRVCYKSEEQITDGSALHFVRMLTNRKQWQHIINLRYHGTTGAPHPQMKEVMNTWYELVMNKEGYKKWLK